MAGNRRKRASDVFVAAALVTLLAMSFTTSLSGGTDPDYAMQQESEDWRLTRSPTVTCEYVDTLLNLEDENYWREDLHRSYRQGFYRLGRLLDCDLSS